ncbi:cytochrome P450 [Suillus fuscotomentosus]|uniref:Cytochrome P450 n=1 Tax=Suillus fuscotomentosus TaxID=1912939 RepID=A0AAD4EB22_9AGAM|nr:cytochrome P450 [Suillus fuscotomentosus]KAG1902995.1 cytochrome P450 [Suillus fuscotomentosus]
MLQLPDLRVFNSTWQLVLATATCLEILVGVISRAYLSKSESGLPLPPSPLTRRLRGHFIPPRNPFLTVAEWIDEHGPVITIRSRTEKIVIIGRHDAVVDITEKQGGLLADRPRLVAAGEIYNGGLSVIFIPSGNMWRRMRRALHTHLQPKSAEEYEPLHMSHAKNMVIDILEDPANFQNHAATYAATTITKVAYGQTTPTSATDPETIFFRENLRLLRTTLRPGAYIVDMFPWLKYLPWYAQELKRGFKRGKQLNTDQLNRVERQIQNNVDVGPSFVKHMLENVQVHGLTETEMAFLAGTFYVAGFDTTTLAICTVLMAAACFPDEQAQVQAELDAVVGRDRVPTFADEQSLPRLHAFISEALRWRPLVPSRLPHRTTNDVVWNNYCIPAGTTVIGHHKKSISRDPDVFPEPHTFKPERRTSDQGCLRDDLKSFVFGFGRRVCPGQHVATRSVFINSLLILWAFRLTLDPTKPLDDMTYMRGEDQPSFVEFKARVSEAELRQMMQNDPV